MALTACAGPEPAAAVDDGASVIARFTDARALDATPDGTLYVVDAAESVVYVLGDGAPVVLGGAGTGDGALLDPVDVDPTNGQAVFVADEAGTVVHFTSEGRAAETVAVPEVDPTRSARAIGPTPADAPRGRPIAVAAGTDGALYVVEAERGVVLKLDEQRSVERVLGGPGAGALADPVDIAVGRDGTVFVADGERGVIQTFDSFGAPGERIFAQDRLKAVSVAGDSLVAVTPAWVVLIHTRTRSQRVVTVDLGEPLVDAVLTPSGLVGLTRTRLVVLEE